MAKVTGPLFSISASGTVGKAFTFGIWKGIQYVREWFKPANPRTAQQTNMRTAMTLIVAYWQAQGQAVKDVWNAFASGYAMTGFNMFVSRALKAYIEDPGIDVVPTSVVGAGEPPTEEWTWNAP